MLTSLKNPEAKASDDNGATVQAKGLPADCVTGDASRPSEGGGTLVSSAGEKPAPDNLNVRGDSRERPARDNSQDVNWQIISPDYRERLERETRVSPEAGDRLDWLRTTTQALRKFEIYGPKVTFADPEDVQKAHLAEWNRLCAALEKAKRAYCLHRGREHFSLMPEEWAYCEAEAKPNFNPARDRAEPSENRTLRPGAEEAPFRRERRSSRSACEQEGIQK